MLLSVPRPIYASPTNLAPCSACPPSVQSKASTQSFCFFHRIFFNWVQKLADLTFFSVYPPLDGVDGFSLVL